MENARDTLGGNCAVAESAFPTAPWMMGWTPPLDGIAMCQGGAVVTHHLAEQVFDHDGLFHLGAAHRAARSHALP